MKKTIIFTFLLILLTTGCSFGDNEASQISQKQTDYHVDIIKSEVNKNQLNFSAQNNSTGEDLLKQSGVEYKKNGEKIIKLDGVISTLSKTWNLYIDNTRADLNTQINANSKIEFKYEAI